MGDGDRASHGYSLRIVWAVSITSNELLHETGHAVHIAAIHQRPAFLDWPDNDALTEGLGDVAALEVYEPRWQMHYLGDSVPTSLGLRGRYGGIVLDIAWSLFEVRMHRDPGADPNTVWGDITSHYLHITPHPELSWWAMRGQLIDAPGYMANYAIGSIIIADIRARVRQLHGDFTTGDPTWYAFMTDHIYRFGSVTNVRGRDHGFSGASDQRERDPRGHEAHERQALTATADHESNNF